MKKMPISTILFFILVCFVWFNTKITLVNDSVELSHALSALNQKIEIYSGLYKYIGKGGLDSLDVDSKIIRLQICYYGFVLLTGFFGGVYVDNILTLGHYYDAANVIIYYYNLVGINFPPIMFFTAVLSLIAFEKLNRLIRLKFLASTVEIQDGVHLIFDKNKIEGEMTKEMILKKLSDELS